MPVESKSSTFQCLCLLWHVAGQRLLANCRFYRMKWCSFGNVGLDFWEICISSVVLYWFLGYHFRIISIDKYIYIYIYCIDRAWTILGHHMTAQSGETPHMSAHAMSSTSPTSPEMILADIAAPKCKNHEIPQRRTVCQLQGGIISLIQWDCLHWLTYGSNLPELVFLVLGARD